MDIPYQTIVLEENEGAFKLTLNRPDQLNAFNTLMQEETSDALSRLVACSPRVLLITGAGRGFCAGQDLGDRDVNVGPLDLSQGPEDFYNPLVRTLTELPAPVICAVNGVAAGAGVNIAAACDIVVAKRSAKFVQAFSSIGLVPDAGGTWNLSRRMGLA
ncbi:MAG: 2-(1,2-epoxy-1,2-dihydrophenyl)acetyl-CoA isomerase, partial [Arenicella sp.]